MSIDLLEEVVNDVSDRDWSWWPFLWLRPEKHAHLSLVRVMSLSVLYGVPSSVLVGWGITLHRAASVQELLFAGAAFPLLFLFTGSVLVAPMWNRRAERLRARIGSR
jgi:hypothetical protein